MGAEKHGKVILYLYYLIGYSVYMITVVKRHDKMLFISVIAGIALKRCHYLKQRSVYVKSEYDLPIL